MRFSIIIPAHNSEQFIHNALDSIKRQVFTDYELIVVCDACKDNTAKVAESYGAIVYEVNFNADGLTRNYGIEKAIGEYILFIDDDDWWLHEYVLWQIDQKLKETDADILCFSFIFKGICYATPLGLRGGHWIAAWSKCWRRDCIGSTRFSDIGDGSSDIWFNREMLQKPLKIVNWDMPIYYYNYMRKGSITEKQWRNT